MEIVAAVGDAVRGIKLANGGAAVVTEYSPIAVKGSHQVTNPRQPQASQSAVLESRDRRLVNAARSLKPALRPSAADSSGTQLESEQPQTPSLAREKRGTLRTDDLGHPPI